MSDFRLKVFLSVAKNLSFTMLLQKLTRFCQRNLISLPMWNG